MMGRSHLQVAALAACLLFAATCPPAPAGEPAASGDLVDVYTSGSGGYHTYRIPAIVQSGRGTLLAFCEGRKTGRGDHGDIDLVLRRSDDGGRTWEPMQLVYEEGGLAKITIGNPCPVVDRTTGSIWLPMTRDNDRVLVARSDDDGKTWARPVDITADVKQPDWDWYATGPGHGIQLHDGRLLVPCDHRVGGPPGDLQKLGYSHVIYSDDHGKTWKLGGKIGPGMNECQAVELADRSLLLSMRNYLGKSQRAFSRSRDGGLSWTEPQHNSQVYCPTCQASLLRCPGDGEADVVVYCGPGGPGRKALTVRLSRDGGKTWPVAEVLYPGSAAYSDLVLLPGGTIGCLFERDDYGKISFTRFKPESVGDER
jgi:sialidase-1